MHPATRKAIFRRLQAANPAPTTELLHTTPFELLVAVMLSAHTTDRSVNAATRNLFPVANTPAAIAALGVEGVKPYIRPVGLYNTTHIFRVANRTGLAPGRTPREVEEALTATTPAEFRRNAHHWLILHGRYTCIARAPKCPTCIIRDLCEYPHKTRAAPARRAARRLPLPSRVRSRRPRRTRRA